MQNFTPTPIARNRYVSYLGSRKSLFTFQCCSPRDPSCVTREVQLTGPIELTHWHHVCRVSHSETRYLFARTCEDMVELHHLFVRPIFGVKVTLFWPTSPIFFLGIKAAPERGCGRVVGITLVCGWLAARSASTWAKRVWARVQQSLSQFQSVRDGFHDGDQGGMRRRQCHTVTQPLE